MDEAETPMSPHSSPRPVGFAFIPAKPAVYACFAADGSLIVAATTANLRRALQNRLSEQTSATGRANYAEIADTVRYRRVGSAFAASWWYYRTVRTLFPDRYAAMLAWKPAWFVTINLATEFPRFHISNALAAASALCVGPLLTRRKAKAIAESMEDLFDLCRYY
ncbi:UvrB/UvrC protein, partial [mine drainage metagenome]